MVRAVAGVVFEYGDIVGGKRQMSFIQTWNSFITYDVKTDECLRLWYLTLLLQFLHSMLSMVKTVAFLNLCYWHAIGVEISPRFTCFSKMASTTRRTFGFHGLLRYHAQECQEPLVKCCFDSLMMQLHVVASLLPSQSTQNKK